MDQETLSLLDFDSVLSLLAEMAQSALGKSRIRELHPFRDRRQLEERLALVEQCLNYRGQQGRPALHTLEDPRSLLSELRVQGQVLSLEQLAFALAILRLARQARSTFPSREWPRLAALVEELADPGPLIGELERVIDPEGRLRDDASPELARVRRHQSRSREKAQQHLGKYLSGSRSRALIADPYITIRNDRYVIPVREERQKEVAGVIHGTSSSGATLFVEPFTVVDLNNRILQYLDEEQEIIRRLLAQLSDLLRDFGPDLVQWVERLALLDLLFAVAEFGRRFDAVVPSLNDRDRLAIEQARHPLLEQSLGRDSVVAISVELSEEERVLIISGPNTGGKTVALKTIGLFCLMTRAGLPLPAARADLPMVRKVEADLGDHQSISAHLSSFSAHIQRVRRMMDESDPPMLVLLDEVGRATDPDHGAALAVAVVDHFRQAGNLVVATTHHPAVKAFAFSTPGVKNASVQLDPESLLPTYQLEFGLAGDSSGLEIAGQLGLDGALVERARSLLDDRTVQIENYLSRLRRELELVEQCQSEVEREKERLTALELDLEKSFQRRREGLEKEWGEKLERLAAEFRQETERWARSLKDRFDAARVRQERKRKEMLLKESFRRKMQSEHQAPPATGGIEEGDWVHHLGFGQQGRVLELGKAGAVVEISGKRVNAALEQLRRSEPSAPRPLPGNVTLDVVEEEVRELNLIGLTVEEALEKADKFLDRAFVSSMREVRLIHGFGKGRLKTAISGFLATHPQVDGHRVEGGVTVVTLAE